jgi:SAM-dependent methyltransferase
MAESLNKETPYDIELKVEGFHWWFAGRRKLLGSLLLSIDFSFEELAIDIGCSVGSNLKILTSTGIHAVGLDYSIYALSLAKSRLKLPLINGDLNQLPVRSKSVGLIIAMDILEHLEDDANGIRELYRVLKNEGTLILTVPAFSFLWGIQDDVTGHRRRYSKKEISNKLRRGGFDILKSSYFNFFLFFPIFFGRRLIRLFGLKIESENKINSPLVNFFLKTVFSLELHVLKRFSFPFGVSIFCIAKKR